MKIEEIYETLYSTIDQRQTSLASSIAAACLSMRF